MKLVPGAGPVKPTRKLERGSRTRNAAAGAREAPAAVAEEVETQIAEFAGMNLGELREDWGRRFRTAPPKGKSASLLRRFLAWRIQEEAFGGLSATTKRRLASLARAFARDPKHQPVATVQLKPGVVLVREWKGRVYKVEAEESGFTCNGERYRSLSEVAPAITGTRWSGPAFFGLRPSKARAGSTE